MAMPSFSPFLKTPINRAKRKEKIRFTFPADDADEVDVDLDEDKVDYVTRSLNHLEPAFRRPNEEDDNRVADFQMGLGPMMIVFQEIDDWN